MNNPIIPFYKQIDSYIVKAKGCHMFDNDNKQYIDFESGDWAAGLGHSNDRITQVLKTQAEVLVHDGLRFKNKESEALSLKLLEVLGLVNGKSVFVNSGSEAVNLAITLAKSLTGRKKILKMDCSYLSAYGHGQITADNSDLVNVPINEIGFLSQIDFKEIAAFAFEPGNSSSLIKFPSHDFIHSIVLSIKQHGGLLIANEVTTGFGRTGKWFGFQHYDFQPDMVATGKALGNGYPISGVCVTSELSDLFDKFPFRYAQSHQNDPLGCAVALEVIRTFEREAIVHQSFSKGKYFAEQLIQLQAKYNTVIKEIRARGLMIGLEFTSLVNAENVYLQLMDQGFLVGQKENTLRFMPPLIIEIAHIDKLMNAIDSILSPT